MHGFTLSGSARLSATPRMVVDVMRVMVAVAVAVVAFVVTVPAAFAGTGFSINPIFPRFGVTVGQTGLPAAIQVKNESTSLEASGSVTLDAINLVPACATLAATGAGDCPAIAADPGVFQLSPSAVGEAGTGCAGQVFDVAVIDPVTGQVAFQPLGPPVVLSPPGTANSVCRIDFTLNILKAPAKPVGASPPGSVATAQIGSAVGTSAVNGTRGLVVGSSVTGMALATAAVFGTGVTVGQTGRPAFLQVANFSTSLEGSGSVTLSAINLVPACATLAATGAGDCPAMAADPGVFRLSPSAAGEADTGCAGQAFTVVVIDPVTGQVAFQPVGLPVVLSPPGTADSVCRIDFTLSVLKAPTKPVGTSPPNTVATAQIAFAGGTSAVNGAPGLVVGSSVTMVATGAPALRTTAAPTALLGTPITDTAHIAGASPSGPPPAGTITFALYHGADCAGTPDFTATVAVTGAGDYTSAAFSPTAAGTYRWAVKYSGDANNPPAASACGAANSSVTVACNTAVTGDHVGTLVVRSGSTCLASARLRGNIIVSRGALLDIENSMITGSIVATSPSVFRLCGATVGGSVIVIGATGLVLIGHPGDDRCTTNKIGRSRTGLHNTAGVVARGNHVTGVVAGSGKPWGGPLGQATTGAGGQGHAD